jgi:hypothetical protein
MHYSTETLKNIFELSVKEIESVLNGSKQITDITRLAANSLTNFVKLRASELQEKALQLEEKRLNRYLENKK